MVLPCIALIGLCGLFYVPKAKRDGWGFLCSSLFLIGGLSTTAASIFPKLLPSTNNIVASLTIENMAAHRYGLSVGFTWFFVALFLVITYFVIQFRIFSNKMDNIGYGEH